LDRETFLAWGQKIGGTRANLLVEGHNFWEGHKFFWTSVQFFGQAPKFCSRTKLFEAHTIFLTPQFFGTEQYFGIFIKYIRYAHNLDAQQQNFLGGTQIFLYISPIFCDAHKIF
jgi:hypothetical protein